MDRRRTLFLVQWRREFERGPPLFLPAWPLSCFWAWVVRAQRAVMSPAQRATMPPEREGVQTWTVGMLLVWLAAISSALLPQQVCRVSSRRVLQVAEQFLRRRLANVQLRLAGKWKYWVLQVVPNYNSER